jgi:hypothetical protein
MDLSRFYTTILIVYCAANLLICAFFSGPAAFAQQAPLLGTEARHATATVSVVISGCRDTPV